MPCYDIPGNAPPYYPQGIGACGDIDLDFGAAPNLIRGPDGRMLVGAGQKSGVYHVFDAKTMEPVWTQIVGPPTPLGGIVGSTAYDGDAVYGPITVPGYVWSLGQEGSLSLGGAGRRRRPLGRGGRGRQRRRLHDRPDRLPRRLRRPHRRPAGETAAAARRQQQPGFAVMGRRERRPAHRLRRGRHPRPSRGPRRRVHARRRSTISPEDVGETGGGLGGGGGDDGGGGGGGDEEGGGSDPPIIAGPGAASTSYATPVATTSVGGSLTSSTSIVAKHDVVSVEKGSDGRPLFSTPLIDLGETAPVEGLDRVSSGKSYEFFCSIHQGMRGTLSVR